MTVRDLLETIHTLEHTVELRVETSDEDGDYDEKVVKVFRDWCGDEYEGKYADWEVWAIESPEPFKIVVWLYKY